MKEGYESESSLKRRASTQISESTATKEIKMDISSQKWWEKEEEGSDKIKWEYLEHNGVLFPKEWQQHNVRPIYKGKELILTKDQEELATYWAQSLETEWENKEIYRKNFASIFLKSFSESLDFKEINFLPIKQYLETVKENKKNRSQEERDAEKKDKADKDYRYGFALVDYALEKVGGYLIEPPTLFKGRGEHPKAGLLKGRIYPEDITLNLAKNAPVPKCQVKGRSWGDVF